MSIEDYLSVYSFGGTDSSKLNTTRTSSYYLMDNMVKAFMDVHVDHDVFEIPTFALNGVMDALSKETPPRKVTVPLSWRGLKVEQKSVKSKMNNAFVSPYQDGLVKLRQDGSMYFVTNGAIFNEEMNPMVISTWLIRKLKKSNFKYKLVKPVLYVSASIFERDVDSVQKFIVGNILPTFARSTFHYDYHLYCILPTIEPFRPHVIIDDLSSLVRKIVPPTINVTDMQLRNAVLESLNHEQSFLF